MVKSSSLLACVSGANFTFEPHAEAYNPDAPETLKPACTAGSPCVCVLPRQT
jgi:hypothetical protein